MARMPMGLAVCFDCRAPVERPDVTPYCDACDRKRGARDRDLIRDAMRYRSGEDHVNTVYLGSMVTAGLYHTLGLKYGQRGFDKALDRASRQQLDSLLEQCARVIEYMRAHPTASCPTCGQITKAPVAAPEKRKTMRIVKPGTKPPRMFRGTCTKCGCVFEDAAENLIVEMPQRDGDFARVSCPQCRTAAIMYPVQAGSTGSAGWQRD